MIQMKLSYGMQNPIFGVNIATKVMVDGSHLIVQMVIHLMVFLHTKTTSAEENLNTMEMQIKSKEQMELTTLTLLLQHYPRIS